MNECKAAVGDVQREAIYLGQLLLSLHLEPHVVYERNAAAEMSKK